MSALWHTHPDLGWVAVLLLVGLLCGRYLRHRRLAQAWTDGLHFGLQACPHTKDAMDKVAGQLDEAARQTRPDPAYPRWWN